MKSLIRYVIEGRVYDSVRGEWGEWGQLFKDGRNYANKNYANRLLRQFEKGFARDTELRVTEVPAPTCPHCGQYAPFYTE